MPTLTIIEDCREKQPLPFPSTVNLGGTTRRVIVKRKRLETADYILGDEKGNAYCLPDYPFCGIIERKASLSELAQNLLTPHRRVSLDGHLTRMRSTWSHPFLLLEGGLSTLYDDRKEIPGDTVRDAFISLLLRRDVHILFSDGLRPAQRRQTADFVLRLLFACQTMGVPRCPTIIPQPSAT